MATSRNLRNALVNELTKIFEKDLGKNIKFYEQELPKKKYEKDEPALFPFILLEVDSGEVPQSSSDEINQCKINIITGVNTDDDEQPETLSLVDRICLYLIDSNIIGEQYEIISSVKWQIGKDEVAPYEYGVIEVTFSLPKISTKQSEFV